tara:strand:+ start:167 stop:595 length:429 start_codon:yes stop_codon:yes gene_type:complete
MIRLFFVIILFLIYGNFNFVINDIVVFSLINIAFFTVLKEKNIKVMDIFIFILSTFVVEVFVGLPILIGIVVLFIPLLILNYFINNYNFSTLIKSLIVFLLSLIAFFLFDQTIVFRLLNLQYFLCILILTFIFLGLSNYGKE